jgi:hypothetical protein
MRQLWQRRHAHVQVFRSTPQEGFAQTRSPRLFILDEPHNDCRQCGAPHMPSLVHTTAGLVERACGWQLGLELYSSTARYGKSSYSSAGLVRASDDELTMQPCSIQFVFLGKVIFCRACTAEKPRMMACDYEKQSLAAEAVAWMPIDVPMKGLSAKPLQRSLRRHPQRCNGQLRSAHASRASRAVPSPCSAKWCAPRCSQLIRQWHYCGITDVRRLS